MTDRTERMIANAAAFGILCGMFLILIWHNGLPTKTQAVLLCAFVLLLTLTINRKSFSTYLIVVIFPICLAVVSHKKPLLSSTFFAFLSAIATLEPSLWFRWMREGELNNGWSDSGVSPVHFHLFFACEVILVGGYLALLWTLWRLLWQRPKMGRELRDSERNIFT